MVCSHPHNCDTPLGNISPAMVTNPSARRLRLPPHLTSSGKDLLGIEELKEIMTMLPSQGYFPSYPTFEWMSTAEGERGCRLRMQGYEILSRPVDEGSSTISWKEVQSVGRNRTTNNQHVRIIAALQRYRLQSHAAALICNQPLASAEAFWSDSDRWRVGPRCTDAWFGGLVTRKWQTRSCSQLQHFHKGSQQPHKF